MLEETQDDDLLDVNDIDSELKDSDLNEDEREDEQLDEQEEEAGGEGEREEPGRHQKLLAALGDLGEGEQADQLIDGLTPEQVAKLPASVRGLALAAIRQGQRELDTQRAALTARREKLGARSERLKADARRVLDERAKLAQVANSAELQKLLKEAEAIDPDKLDPLSEDGQRLLAKKEAAKAFQTFAEPLQRAAVAAERQQLYRQMKDANPRMNNKEFRAKVFDFAKQRQDAGRPVSLQDAHDLVVHAEQIEARQVTRK